MKALQIGGGSMGKRRIRDLVYLLDGQVILFEPSKKRCEEVANKYRIKGFTDVEAALVEQPEIMSISTPPVLHDQYVNLAMKHKMHVFAESPFLLEAKALQRLLDIQSDNQTVLGVSCSLRYYPPCRLIHDLIHADRIGKPLYVEYTLGNYLPDWHPNEDYRKFYGGDAKLGGCGMDMIFFEFAAIQWWLGPLKSLQSRLSKVSDLEIDGPDCHDVLLTFESGCRGYFHNDIIERGSQGRYLKVVGETGTIEWHQPNDNVRIFEERTNSNSDIPLSKAADWDEAIQASKEVSELIAKMKGSSISTSEDKTSFSFESCYLREMRHFIEAAQGQHQYTMATLKEELRTVQAFHLFQSTSNVLNETNI
jgi:predicted dehydrogenase